MGKASDWRTRRVSRIFAADAGGGVRFLIEEAFFVAKRRWADEALAWHGVDDPSAWHRYDVPGTNVVIFTKCPFDPAAMAWKPEFLAKQRAYQAELDAVLDGPAPKSKASRKRKGA